MADEQRKDHNPNGWVPCNESLPIDGMKVLVWCRCAPDGPEEAAVAVYDGEWLGLPDGVTPTHWMFRPVGPTSTEPNDAARINWLEENRLQFDRVRELVLDGSDIRDAIDDVMNGKDVDDEEEGE